MAHTPRRKASGGFVTYWQKSYFGDNQKIKKQKKKKELDTENIQI